MTRFGGSRGGKGLIMGVWEGPLGMGVWGGRVWGFGGGVGSWESQTIQDL